MVQKTKKNEGRLDKYYHMAKEQGYRSRAAFKLMQLNKKYEFLSTARCLLDLCAAPGGWLQVAKKFMPVNSTLIGVDICPIKSIPNVTTIEGDITHQKTMLRVKNQLRGQKCDVVLHDGAPNMGTSWLKDSFTQSELCLYALKMATEFLKPEGIFITKVFRSKDYTSLLWVLNQFFTKVEATKPKASRDASAEIFVCCFGYKAPSQIDPNLFNASVVFEEVDTQKKKLSLSFKDLIKAARNPNREGYEDGATVLFKKCSVAEFIDTEQPIKILADYNELEFDEASTLYLNQPETNKQIVEACEDIKILGKQDFRMLLKWRKRMQEVKEEHDAQQMGVDEELSDAEEEKVTEQQEGNDFNKLLTVDDMDIPSDEEELSAEVKEMRDKQKKLLKKKESKIREKKKKLALKAAAERDEDMIDTLGDNQVFSIKDIKSKSMLSDVLDPTKASEAYESYMQERLQEEEDEEAEEAALKNVKLTEEEEEELLEAELDLLYQQLMEKKKKRYKQTILQLRNDKDAEKNTLYESIKYEDEKYGESKNPLLIEHKDLSSNSTKANQFFNQNIFKVLREEETGNSDNEDENSSRTKRRLINIDQLTEEDLESSDDESGAEEDDDDEEAIKEMKNKVGETKPTIDNGGFEEIPKEMNDPEVRATTLAIAKRLLNKKERRDYIDDSFNRFAFGAEEEAPQWLQDEETEHYVRQAPVTKEEVEEMKKKFQEIDNRPIKAVLEAKIRRKFRAQKKLKQVKEKAELIATSQELTPQERAKELMKLYKGAKVNDKKKKIYVVGGKHKTGNTSKNTVLKFVDSRLKKDRRSEKNADKKRKR
ncbi:hypothetical protein ABK040_006737 [Willaertia magna]